MKKYLKKPVEVEAEQWFRVGFAIRQSSALETKEEMYHLNVMFYERSWFNSGDAARCPCGKQPNEHGWLKTPEGGVRVCPGDWIIRNEMGRLSVCKKDMFDLLYEPLHPAFKAKRPVWLSNKICTMGKQ